ncbi:hypothetical protein LJC09_01415 [Desulfovibrio sp. OttesenSCG-928-F20]|nr:hypothetical protein [Desulfovibrio sp. OttesenSCG-928-F20]
MKQLLIFDPGMLSAFGHHYAYNSALRDAAKELDLGVHWLFSNKLSQELATGFTATPLPLPWSLYGVISKLDDVPVEALGGLATRLATGIGVRLDAIRSCPDIIFGHTLHPVVFLAILVWQASRPCDQRPTLALNLMFGVDESVRCRSVLAHAAKLLKRDMNTALFAGTRSAAALLEQCTGHSAMMLPSPLPARVADYARPAGQSGPLFSLLGDARVGKNLQVLPEALLRYIHGGGCGRFVVRMAPTDAGIGPIFIALHDLSREFSAQITLSLERLSERDYYHSLGCSDALVIPYDASAYTRFRPSGLVIESAALGVPAICAKGGFMEEELAHLDNGSLFLDAVTPESLCEAFFVFEKEYAGRKQKALARAANYRRSHNAKTVLRLICGAR